MIFYTNIKYTINLTSKQSMEFTKSILHPHIYTCHISSSLFDFFTLSSKYKKITLVYSSSLHLEVENFDKFKLNSLDEEYHYSEHITPQIIFVCGGVYGNKGGICTPLDMYENKSVHKQQLKIIRSGLNSFEYISHSTNFKIFYLDENFNILDVIENINNLIPKKVKFLEMMYV